nr:DUF4012 domain-containing protein [Candidatus Shapirobacteria bacterium]
DRAPGSEVAVTKKNFKWPRIKFNFNFEGKKWGWGLGIVVGTLLLGLVVGVAGQYQMVKDTMKIQGLVKTRKYQEANVLIGKIEKKLRSSEEMAMDLGLVGTTWGRRYLSVLKVWGEGLSLGKDIVSLVQKSEIIADGILKEKELDWNKEFGSLEVAGVAVEEKSGVLQARMMGNWSWMPARWKSQWQDAVELISNSRQTVSKLVQMVEVMPDLIGVGSKRKEYLVLLQNESELRPNGGFIGSYGILSFDGGKLINFDVNDVYETDGQLKGHVEPPVPIKKYLGEGGWFLRDANWSPDFNQSSKDIQWFFEKETGRKIDGVIGINLSMAKAILGVIGEVYVPDFKEKINSRNLYEQAEYYSETKSFPGSTQKASFLGGLAKQLFEEIKNMSPDKRLKMAEAMIDMLDRNEMQLAINDKLVAEKMAKVGWDGGVYRGKCAQARCFADYLYVVEANLGVNKANYFLYRAMEQSVDISNNSISRVLKLNYENTAKSNAWPGGDYKNYLRVYVPETANLAEVSIVNDSGIKTIVGGDDLVVNQVLGKKEIGFLVMVPTGKKRQVEVRYVDSIDLSKSEKFSYLNYIQKQSGFGDTGLVSLVSVPDGWQVIQVEPEASLVKGKALFNQKLLKDIKMGVEISK